ncbi:UPF0262 family protein [Terricaulis sp.]|uniref:UPF0262 family protein n=1 Tax=Terricaulis sp. TaxID=2768686 RepID=UPI0037830A84
MSGETNRLAEVTLDEASLAPGSANAEQERRIALFDLKESNSFVIVGEERGPYHLVLSTAEGRLIFDVSTERGDPVVRHPMSLSSMRKLVKDYGLICETYFDAIRTAPPSRIEAIDMGRRGLHNEAAEVLMGELEERFVLDLDTARRLFTLICALHVRG